MGREHSPLNLIKENILRLPAPLTVIATEQQLTGLRAAKGSAWIADAKLLEADLDQNVDYSGISEEGIVVVQVDPSVPASMGRIEHIKGRHPDVSIVVALDNADLKLVRTLIREGVADVVSLPLDPEELLQTVVAILEVASKSSGSTDLAPMIATARSLGGTGATTMVTSLASELARRPECVRGICIIDLDIQYGAVADVLGLSPRRTLADLMDAEERLDGAFLQTVAAKHESGIFIIAAPQDIVPLEAIDTRKLQSVIATARREFDYVLLDMPSNWTTWSLSIMLEADSILMMVEQSLSSLRQARRRLDLFKRAGVDMRLVSIVVNRLEKRLFGSISLADVAEALNQDVLCGLRLEGKSISDAQAQGMLVDQVKPKSNYVTDIAKLAEIVAVRLSVEKKS
jgi:pilus assembly protein CpaE